MNLFKNSDSIAWCSFLHSLTTNTHMPYTNNINFIAIANEPHSRKQLLAKTEFCIPFGKWPCNEHASVLHYKVLEKIA